MDYKQTLNLPKTAFSMKANLAQREPQRLAQWESRQLYHTIREQCAGRPTYVLHDGPPYANAPIHLGTSLNKILKDFVIKSKTLSGFDAPYVPGWDCHGLPIELKVEKKVGKPGVKLDHDAFRQACREFAGKQVEIQKADFKRLGVQGDWDQPYLSMDPTFEANELRALARIIEAGHLERGQKPVHWCTDCNSALAEAEVDYQDKTSPAIDVAFDVIDLNAAAERLGVDAVPALIVPIWTTTPWTLPANQAVALNAKLTYVVLAVGDHALLVAEGLKDAVIARYDLDQPQTLATCQGEQLAGLELQHPFLDRVVPIVLGDHVTTEAGTGNVHTAPAHGLDDYLVGQREGLPDDCPVNGRSCFVDDIPIVGGMHVFKANQPIIETLQARGKLLHLADLTHSYPHCWRHKKPLIFRATPQWFISMEKAQLREQALSAVNNTRWIPSWGENRIGTMIASRPDWCISRQRTWGVPIALFVHKETAELHPNSAELMRQVADAVEAGGIDVWYSTPIETWLGDEADQYERVTDTLDVWFDSGVTHFGVLEQRAGLQVPADMYLEGSDQHRGWFQTSLLTGVAMRGQAPFKTVVTHGYVVDGKGHKMSKSVGNTIAPKDVINKLGADVLRLWAASSDISGDIKVSDEIFKRCSDAYRRIRNTARFLLSNLYDYDPAIDAVACSEMTALDCWAMQHAQDTQSKIIAAYEACQFQVIYQLIHNFCAVEMGSFYLDIIKDRLYTAKSDSVARRSAQTAMMHILELFVRWIAPILSFTADEIWECMPGARQSGEIFYTQWIQPLDIVANAEIDWVQLIPVRDAVNRELELARQSGAIGSGLDARVTVHATGEVYQALSALGEELRFVLITSDAHVVESDTFDVTIAVCDADKCARCWQRRSDVGQSVNHPTLCGRCIDNVSGHGEERRFA